MTPASDFVSHLRRLAAERPRDTALVVVAARDGATVDTPIGYAALDRRVRALAARLQARCTRGDRVLLLLDNDDHHVVGFLACLYAGLVAVPAFPPESARPQHLARLTGIARDAQPRVLLASTATQALVGDAFGACEALGVDADTDANTDAAGLAEAWRPHEPQPGDIAFLQYTSGSTSAPKGVMVSHANLMANERAIEQGFDVRADDVFVSWLPLYHDMGLIGGLLQPLHRGIPCVLMTPQCFLERPVRWLEAIARHRGSISGGPDFAYRLCLDRIRDSQCAGLDLSSWRVAFCGAEPIRHATLQGFGERFAGLGFEARTLFPCYGLAEATLFVAGARPGEGLRSTAHGDAATPLVSCGPVAPGHAVEIVDAKDGVGEIQVAGPSIAQGYWRNQSASEAVFVERAGRRWLRTGDLGFLRDGELYVTGRLKDLIILRGQNVYPQDIERAVEAGVEAARPGRVAAFAVPLPGGGEGVGVAMEVARAVQKRLGLAALVEDLGRACAGVCREPVSVAVLLNPGALPKTSSGKLQRSACRQGWLDGTLDAFAVHVAGAPGREAGGGEGKGGGEGEAPAGELEAALAGLWQQVLGHATPPGRAAHFFAAGGNSIAAVQLAGAIAERWNIAFEPRQVFAQPAFADLAGAVREALAHGVAPAPIPVLDAARRHEALPLSHAQLRQWFLWQLAPSSTAYHVSHGLCLRGALDIARLQSALDALVRRHESLRTVFELAPDGTPRQRIRAVQPVALSCIDLRAADADRRDAALQGLCAQAFDLLRGPLLRVAVLRTAELAQQLVVVMHHIVSDGASMQLLLDELAAGYAGEAPPPALRLQCVDHALWQRERLEAGEGARQLAWWRDQLAHDGEAEPVLALATDHPRRPQAHHRAAHHAFSLPPALYGALQQAAQAQQATLSMLLLGVFQGLLHRYTGQPDVRVGVPVANRLQPGTQGLIGLFVNTLVLRNRIDGRLSLAGLVAQARDAARGAQAHPDLPFDRLVEALQPQRSAGHNPLFQAMFNHYAEDPGAWARLPGLAVEALALPAQAAQVELALEARERPGEPLQFRLVHAAELFEPATMARFAEHYLALLQALVQRPAQALREVDLLSAAEHARLRDWGVDAHRFDDWQPVHRSFEQRVREAPDAPALHVAGRTLTRAELNRRANRLAHRLAALGIGPDQRVGVAIERSVEMMVAVLAVLKAGGAFVPLDTELPAERLAGMAEDSRIALLLTHGPVRDRVPARDGLPVLDLDTLDTRGEPDHDPRVALHAEHLAYVIYTSGSTGRPKGAAVRQRALASCMAWMQQAYRLDATDAVLHKAAFGFDVSCWEMFWPLTTGTRLVLAEPGEHRDPARLARLILAQGVTTLNFVPSMLLAFLQQPGTDGAMPLRRVVVGGEALPAEVQKEVALRLPQATLYNLYGPTETTIHVTHWTCRADGRRQVPIGRPITETTARVLDPDLNLVPAGVAGELYIGGVSLARGYLHRPGLTADRFVADPFDPQGGRLYRTGDLVRWRPDEQGEGQLDYLGRIDHQVKVRGFRIELGEVEARLLAEPAVRDALVAAVPGPAGLRLVAWVTPQAGQHLEPPALRRALGRALPDYMVPGAIVVLDAMPLTPNGKLDRKALPEPVFESDRAYVAPAGALAETLAAVWREVLGVARVGLHDNFFDLGGHSLALVRVHRLLQDRLGAAAQSLQLVELFAHPTLDALAQRLGRGGAAASTPDPAAADDRTLRRRAALQQRRRAPERTS